MKEKGFTLIELMIAVAVIGILSSIAVPNYMGVQKKTKMRSIAENIARVKSDLQSWMTASAGGELGVVDVNGDGQVTAAEALPPLTGVATAYVNLNTLGGIGTTASPGYDYKSPFTGGPLFLVGAGVAGCGQIGVQPLNGGRTIVLQGWNNDPASLQPIFTETITIE
jgi:prepilin-type N-terminal cleavage/methylation domain-containing protein